jgi:polyisoprenoid-binding protein YceI
MAFSAAPEPVPIKIDKNHSNIGFAVPIMGGLSEVHGKFADFETDFRYDLDDISKSSITVSIKAGSIDTGIDQRDAHLRTADFFDSEKYPDIVFKSSKVQKTGPTNLLVGDLTMHGVTKTVAIPFKITGLVEDKEKGTFVTGFRGELTLNRRDFGINYSHQSVAGFIGDDVNITLALLTRSNKLPGKK